MKELSGLEVAQPTMPLQTLLKGADLLHYYDPLKNVLKLRHAGDLCYTDHEDLDGIGMSRPEQRRLFKEYAKYFPGEKAGGNGFVGKIKKVFRKNCDGKMAKKGDEEQPAVAHDEQIFQRKDEADEDAAGQQQQQHIIPASRISLCREIGSGEFGCVFQAAWHRDGPGGEVTQVAVKRILPEKLISQPASFLQEAAIMTRMHHENVVRLFGVVLDTKAVMLVSELAPCGSLLECLQSPAAGREPFSLGTLCDFALQIARGMAYLSGQRLIHRDLAARNVLVSTPTKVKISDFGLSRSLGHGEDYYRSELSPTMKLPIAWCAPECINFLRFTSASDVWAYGVCLWEMFSFGKTPWAGMTGSKILHAIDTQRMKLERPEACPDGMYKLMMCCWEWEAERRPSFKQICDQLPALTPPLLLTVTECRPTKEGHLRYAKGDTIVLLEKSSVYPGFWLGVSKSGQVGVFRPEDTIAYLGAEKPSAASTTLMPINEQRCEGKAEKKPKDGKKKGAVKKDKKVEAKNGKMNKEGKCKERPIISQPKQDLRHTCHVGADGRSFGLLNVDKNDLPRALPPRVASPCCAIADEVTSPIMISSTISLAPPRPPKGTSFQSDPMSRSFCAEMGTEFGRNGFSSSSSSQAPQLPPKPPRFRTRQSQFSPLSSPITESNGMAIEYIQPVESGSHAQEGSTSPFPLDQQERQSRSSTSPTETIKRGNQMEVENEDEEKFLRPASICLEQLELKQKPSKSDQKEDDENDEERILQILTGLQRDLSEFSVSTLGDCSEERALLDGEQRRVGILAQEEKKQQHELPALRTSMVVGMEPEEFARRLEEERKRTSKQLSKPDAKSGSASPVQFLRLLAGNGLKTAEAKQPQQKPCEEEDLPRSKKSPVLPWPPEADQAYRLMVQCGHMLKGGIASSSSLGKRTPSPREQQNPSGILCNDSALTIQNPLSCKSIIAVEGRSHNPASEKLEKTDYLNTSADGNQIGNHQGCNGNGMRNWSVKEYVNASDSTDAPNGSIAAVKSKSPPPVPPKPRLKVNIRAMNCHMETNLRN